MIYGKYFISNYESVYFLFIVYYVIIFSTSNNIFQFILFNTNIQHCIPNLDMLCYYENINYCNNFNYTTIYLHILEVNKRANTSTLISRNIRDQFCKYVNNESSMRWLNEMLYSILML